MTYFKKDEIEYISPLLEATEMGGYREFWTIPRDELDQSNTFIGALIRYCYERGFGVEINGENVKVAKYLGLSSERDGLTSGMDLERYVAKRTLVAQ